MDKEVQKFREIAKAFREMADATDRVADLIENPDSTEIAQKCGTVELAQSKAGLIEVYNGGQQS